MLFMANATALPSFPSPSQNYSCEKRHVAEKMKNGAKKMLLFKKKKFNSEKHPPRHEFPFPVRVQRFLFLKPLFKSDRLKRSRDEYANLGIRAVLTHSLFEGASGQTNWWWPSAWHVITLPNARLPAPQRSLFHHRITALTQCC